MDCVAVLANLALDAPDTELTAFNETDTAFFDSVSVRLEEGATPAAAIRSALACLDDACRFSASLAKRLLCLFEQVNALGPSPCGFRADTSFAQSSVSVDITAKTELDEKEEALERSLSPHALFCVNDSSFGRDSLSVGASTVYHRARVCSALSFAVKLLRVAADHFVSAETPSDSFVLVWWYRMRALRLHQSLLRHPQLELRDEMDKCVAQLRQKESEMSAELRAMLLIECTLSDETYFRAEEIEKNAQDVKELLQLQVAFNGESGRRTRFQKFDTTQLVCDATPAHSVEEKPMHFKFDRDTGDRLQEVSNALPRHVPLEDEVLRRRPFYTNRDVLNEAVPLSPLEQAVLLAQRAVLLQKHTAGDMTREERRAITERVCLHPTHWALARAALTERSVVESDDRGCAIRAVTQFESLVLDYEGDAIDVHGRAVARDVAEGGVRRLQWLFVVPLMTHWQLRTKLADILLSAGMAKSAIDTFLTMEMWHDAVKAYIRTGLRGQAEQLTRRLLAQADKLDTEAGYLRALPAYADSNDSADDTTDDTTGDATGDTDGAIADDTTDDTTDDTDGAVADDVDDVDAGELEEQKPRWRHVCLQGEWTRRQKALLEMAPALLVLLGDMLERNKKAQLRCYRRAWRLSGGTCAAAALQLADHFTHTVKDLPTALVHFRRATGVHAMSMRAWFGRGHCALSLGTEEQPEYWREAAMCFVRCMAMDQDNGEAWNNLAAAHLHLKQFRHALSALEHATRLQRESWRVWDNYLSAAMQVGEVHKCLTAMMRLLDLADKAPRGRRVHDASVLAMVAELTLTVMQQPECDQDDALLLQRWNELTQKIMSHLREEPQEAAKTWAVVAEFHACRGAKEEAVEFEQRCFRALTAVPRWFDDVDAAEHLFSATRRLIGRFEACSDPSKYRVAARSLKNALRQCEPRLGRDHAELAEVRQAIDDFCAKHKRARRRRDDDDAYADWR